MRRAIVLATAAAAAAVVALGAWAASGPAPVAVSLKEFKLTPSVKTVKAGKVAFTIKNVGKINHEMVVMKTNLPPAKLPVNANHRVPEKGVVGEVGDVHPGQTKRATITLRAGRYVLLCNLSGHYKAGQYSGFVVK